MGKKPLVIIGGFFALLAVGGVLFFFLKLKGRPSLVSPLGQEETAEEIKWEAWEDQAGFSILYPEGTEIDPHGEDEENYAHLELASSEHPGSIIIWVKDTVYTDIEDWAEKEATNGAQIFDTELGGEPAKKVAYAEPERLITAAIDVDALVLIEMTSGELDYWQEIYNQILSSFTFIPLEGEEAAAPGPWEGSGGGGGIIEEPEEVIE